MAYPAMVSGPDLGGGYLHQLTRAVDGDREHYVFHAQDGGEDAGGPPMGSPERLGWTHPSGACQFGGPRCWHREFEVPRLTEVRVRAAYNRTRFVFEAMLSQVHRGAPPPFEESLAEVVDRLAPELERAGLGWHLAGSTAAWVQGVPFSPMEISLGLAADGVEVAAGALGEYLIEPVADTVWSGERSVFGARAFVGTMRRGTRLEFGAERPGLPSRPGDLEWQLVEPDTPTNDVHWDGRRLRASRLEFALARAVARGQPEAVVTAIVRRLLEVGPDLQLLDRALRTARVPRSAADVLGAGVPPR